MREREERGRVGEGNYNKEGGERGASCMRKLTKLRSSSDEFITEYYVCMYLCTYVHMVNPHSVCMPSLSLK